MKKTVKILMTIALCCMSLTSALAQRYYDDRGYSSSRYDYIRTGTVASYLDLHIGKGIGHGANGMAGANASFLYRFAPEFQFGIGAGVDYIHALSMQGKADKKNEYDYHGELTLPVFMRGRFLMGEAGYTRSASFFIQCDMGYRFGIAAYNTGKNKGLVKNFEKTNVKGFFVEPQFGIAPNETISFSIGLPFQRYNKFISDLPIASTPANAELKSKSLMFMGAQLHFMISF